MFGHLTDFGYRRTFVEAIGFYLAYLVTGMIFSGILGMVAGLVNASFGFDGGLTLGATVAIGICPVLVFMILRAKGLLGHLGFLLVGVLSVAGAIVGGLLLGLVFVAFLTTRPAVRRPEMVEAGPTFA
jgi:hypothetical protein